MGFNMIIKTVVVGELETNCYIISEGESCAIIDPGAEGSKILQAIKGDSPHIILTHAHPDHIGAVGEIMGKLKGQIYLHSFDSRWLKQMLGSAFPGLRNAEENEIIKIGSLKSRIIHTPGHTQGSICLYLEKEGVIFTGDTLFAGGVGRTDLPGGDESALRSSLRKLMGLPGSVKVYPGHGPQTTIKKEKDNWMIR